MGTSFVYDDASRPGEDGQLDSRLKYDRTGPVPIILVPQPSDDPNDPLVTDISQCIQRQLMSAELASMEARFDPRHPFSHLRHSLHFESSSGCKHCHFVIAL